MPPVAIVGFRSSATGYALESNARRDVRSPMNLVELSRYAKDELTAAQNESATVNVSQVPAQ